MNPVVTYLWYGFEFWFWYANSNEHSVVGFSVVKLVTDEEGWNMGENNASHPVIFSATDSREYEILWTWWL
jgi:hypothetical protein